MYLIWSHRKKQWWGPNKKGYTIDIPRAGRYNAQAAGDIMIGALPGQNVAVDETIVHNRLAELNADEIVETIDSFRNY